MIVENGGVTDLRPDAGSVVVERTPQWLGSVPAMARAMLAAQMKFGQRAEVIVALHDDVEIDQAGWDAEVLSHFATHPQCGLAGFSGALGLGSSDIYQAPYSSIAVGAAGLSQQPARGGTPWHQESQSGARHLSRWLLAHRSRVVVALREVCAREGQSYSVGCDDGGGNRVTATTPS